MRGTGLGVKEGGGNEGLRLDEATTRRGGGDEGWGRASNRLGGRGGGT